MKRKPTCFLMMMILLFVQCRKEKNDQPPPDLSTGLLAYFQLNGDFTDSAKAIVTQYGGFLNYTNNRYGYANRAIAFNGGQFSFGTPWLHANPITISLWVKPKDLNTNSYLVLSVEEAFGVYQQASKLGLSINIPGNAAALADITTEWTHFAGTYDGKDIKTYINGKLASTVHHPGVPDVTSHINIGGAGLPEWKGSLDDVRFYNRVLTAKEITHLAGLQ